MTEHTMPMGYSATGCTACRHKLHNADDVLVPPSCEDSAASITISCTWQSTRILARFAKVIHENSGSAFRMRQHGVPPKRLHILLDNVQPHAKMLLGPMVLHMPAESNARVWREANLSEAASP